MEEDQKLATASASFIVLHNIITKKKTRRKKRFWSHQLYLQRSGNNLNMNNISLLHHLREPESDLFKNFTRMSQEDFKFLLNKIGEKISKKDTKFRKAIPIEERLATTLRFLATGDSFTSLQYLFRVSKQSISEIVPEVCKAIIESLQDCVKVSIHFVVIFLKL